MMKNMFWMMLLSAGFSLYTLSQSQLGAQLKDKKNQAVILKALRDYKNSLKHAKLKFAGQEIPLNFNKDSFSEYVKTEPRAQRAFFVFGLFMLNVWLVPLAGRTKQLQLKKELFDSHKYLKVDFAGEFRRTPYYSSTFFERLLYIFYPGLLMITLSFISPEATVFFVGLLGVYAFFNYLARVKKYQSLNHFYENRARGDGLVAVVKHVISFFTSAEQNNAYDDIYRDALVRARKNSSGRKAG
jgi:hypothetical protein